MADTNRKIKQIIEPEYVVEGAGVLLRRSFGPKRSNLYDPFLLFDHFAFNDPIEGPIVGFPTHPHRGIETVTYMLEGNVRHRDSLGNTGIIGPGAVQWMTSGRGILHEELPKRGPSGIVNGFQLWVNLPATEKMSEPRYQEFNAEDIPTIEQDGVKAKIIAGAYAGLRGQVAEITAQPQYMDFTIEVGGSLMVEVPEGHTAAAYVFEGEGTFGPEETFVDAVKMVIFEDGTHIEVQPGLKSHIRFVLIAGAPFNEPIVPYGPFVMNTQEEIRQVFEDIKSGTFAQPMDA